MTEKSKGLNLSLNRFGLPAFLGRYISLVSGVQATQASLFTVYTPLSVGWIGQNIVRRVHDVLDIFWFKLVIFYNIGKLCNNRFYICAFDI